MGLKEFFKGWPDLMRFKFNYIFLFFKKFSVFYDWIAESVEIVGSVTPAFHSTLSGENLRFFEWMTLFLGRWATHVPSKT